MAAPLYQPYYTNQTFGYWQIPLNVDNGPDDLTNVDPTKMTMYFRQSSTETVGTGTFLIMTIYPAVVLYKPSPVDVATPFSGVIVIKAFFPPSASNIDEVIYDPISFVIIAS